MEKRYEKIKNRWKNHRNHLTIGETNIKAIETISH